MYIVDMVYDYSYQKIGKFTFLDPFHKLLWKLFLQWTVNSECMVSKIQALLIAHEEEEEDVRRERVRAGIRKLLNDIRLPASARHTKKPAKLL